MLRPAICVLLIASAVLAVAGTASAGEESTKLIRVGIIGTDTSHVPAFTGVMNNPQAEGDLANVKVVAAFPGGSPDLPASADRVEKFANTIREKYGVEIVDSIPALLEKVDAVLLESVDGRPHLEQVKPVIKAGKPVFIDKPVAGTLADAVEIFRLAKQAGVPCFSSSSLRFSSDVQALRDIKKVGNIRGCTVYSPCSLEEHHPDLFWYGVHGVEMLFTVMGTGCVSVTRVGTEGTDVVVGVWKDGRIGTFRGIREGKRGYGVTAFTDKGITTVGRTGGYKTLVAEVATFFKTGKPPVSAEETVEIFAFMEAADESKRQGGKPVTIQSVMEKANAQVTARTK